jgi:hypothetical protein
VFCGCGHADSDEEDNRPMNRIKRVYEMSRRRGRPGLNAAPAALMN